MGEFRKPWLVFLRPRVRHHQSCLGSRTWVREGKVLKWAPLLAQSKDRPLLSMSQGFLNFPKIKHLGGDSVIWQSSPVLALFDLKSDFPKWFAGLDSLVFISLTLHFVRLDSEPWQESKSGNWFWKINFELKSAKHGLLCQITESPPKYFVLENLGNPDSCQRPRVCHHQSCLGSGTWVRLGKVSYEHPLSPDPKIGLY